MTCARTPPAVVAGIRRRRESTVRGGAGPVAVVTGAGASIGRTSVFALARAVLPGTLERGHGSIVMSSISSVRPVPGLAAAYPVAKAGLDGLTRTIAVTYGPGGIRCNAVAPGLILADDMPSGPSPTSFDRQGLIREDGRNVDVASVVSFLAFDQSKFINGQTILVDGGIGANLAGVAGRNRVGGA
jgi:NAD(P)-dependent dehydrogenase (short-subunit alcohol dehydrogenase family)